MKRTDRLAIVSSYVWHGVRHILTGYDHLLFVAALVLGAATLWDLIKVVTAFTLAHSLTLTLAALNLVHVPDAVVEPLIAASIVFVAIQNVIWPHRRKPDRSSSGAIMVPARTGPVRQMDLTQPGLEPMKGAYLILPDELRVGHVIGDGEQRIVEASHECGHRLGSGDWRLWVCLDKKLLVQAFSGSKELLHRVVQPGEG